jgi:hypothetical protein
MMDRKAFIYKRVRGSILIAFAVLTAFFYRKGKITARGECSLNTPCANCGELKNCSLPQAQKLRKDG